MRTDETNPGAERTQKVTRDMTAETLTLDQLRQHQLIILRRLRDGPLTEFELVREIADHSGFTADDAAENIAAWLDSLMKDGLVWAGSLENHTGQSICAAALTRSGRKLVG